MKLNPKIRSQAGISIIELMVVVLIVVVVAGAALFGSYSTVKKAKVHSFAQELGSILERARSLAIHGGCPTRIILCDTINCALPISLNANDSQLNAKSIALLRFAPRDSNLDCFSGLHSSADGFENWDFEMKPIRIPTEIGISAIYGTVGALDVSDWHNRLTDSAQKSIWFSVRGETRSSAVDPQINQDLGKVFFQISAHNCNPSLSSNCLGLLVSVDSDGRPHTTSCGSGPLQCRRLD